MIYFLVTDPFSDTIEAYASQWGGHRGARLRVLFYDDLPECEELPRGTYIFSDLERLGPAGTAFAAHLWDALDGSGMGRLNDPSRVLHRGALLQALSLSGQNEFRAWPAHRDLSPLRYPAFLKVARAHEGSASRLLNGPFALRRALWKARVLGYSRRELLAIEFCDTRDADGIFRKYSAFLVGDRVLPRHVLHSRKWELRSPDLESDVYAAESEAFLAQNPHAEQIREIGRLARIDFGRIDYSMLGEKIQVWEINTNPQIRKMALRLTEAFDEIDDAGEGAAIPLRTPGNIVDRYRDELRRIQRRATWRHRIRRLYSWEPSALRAIRTASRPPGPLPRNPWSA